MPRGRRASELRPAPGTVIVELWFGFAAPSVDNEAVDMAPRQRHHLRALGLLQAGVGVLVFAVSMFSNVDGRLLAAISATALVLAGVYLTLPSAITAQARYRIQPRFQAISALVGLVVAAGLDYGITGSIDWTIAVGVAIGVLIGSGFFGSRART